MKSRAPTKNIALLDGFIFDYNSESNSFIHGLIQTWTTYHRSISIGDMLRPKNGNRTYYMCNICINDILPQNNNVFCEHCEYTYLRFLENRPLGQITLRRKIILDEESYKIMKVGVFDYFENSLLVGDMCELRRMSISTHDVKLTHNNIHAVMTEKFIDVECDECGEMNCQTIDGDMKCRQCSQNLREFVDGMICAHWVLRGVLENSDVSLVIIKTIIDVYIAILY